MKAVLISLAVLVVAVVASNERERRFLFNRCSSEVDCSANKCCLFSKFCSRKLFKYSTCHLTAITQCGCGDGLECRVTKEFTILGQRIRLRQCMPVMEKREVEQIEDEDLKAMMGHKEKRFLIDRCSNEADCGENRCCLFGKLCAKKIPKDMTCYFANTHKCGCQNGLECRVTTTITIPIIGSTIPIRQCVPPKE